MADLGSILSSLGGVAGNLAGLIVPGADKLVEAAKSLNDAYNHVKEANGGTAPADAEAAHKALMAKVNAHADSTLGRLEGGG